jgi:hypothetical protein
MRNPLVYVHVHGELLETGKVGGLFLVIKTRKGEVIGDAMPPDTRQSQKLAYSIEELCTAACVGRSTVYAEIGSGRLRPTKIGRRTVITIADAVVWLERRRSESGPNIMCED